MMDLLNVDISIGSRFDNIDLVDDVRGSAYLPALVLETNLR